MRVLLDCRMADWSGVGRYTTGLARALARREDVELLQVVKKGAQPPVLGAEVAPASVHPFSPLGSMEMGRIAGSLRPAITHCAHFMIPFPAGRPLVVTLHDLIPLLVPGVMPSRFKRAVYRHWNAEAVSAANLIVTPSVFTAGTVEHEFPKSIGRIRVVFEAADDLTSGERGLLPSAVGSAPYVLSMGNTRPHKDLPTLLRAFAALAAAHPTLNLVLVGPDQPGYVASVLGDPSLERRVLFTGHVDDATLRALYAAAAVFAFPSTFEGFGLPPLEAMGMGAPVVCSNAASLPEVVDDAALVFERGDAAALATLLARVLDDLEVAKDLRARGTARAQALTWDAAAEATVAVYREAVGHSIG
jgi:glycosyltransferase involved in cell wall biosynthesis